MASVHPLQRTVMNELSNNLSRVKIYWCYTKNFEGRNRMLWRLVIHSCKFKIISPNIKLQCIMHNIFPRLLRQLYISNRNFKIAHNVIEFTSHMSAGPPWAGAGPLTERFHGTFYSAERHSHFRGNFFKWKWCILVDSGVVCSLGIRHCKIGSCSRPAPNHYGPCGMLTPDTLSAALSVSEMFSVILRLITKLPTSNG
jgi:hypothetical protein